MSRSGSQPRISRRSVPPWAVEGLENRLLLSAWTTQVVDAGPGADPGTGYGLHLVADRTGTPHMSYVDDNNLKYATWTGNSWSVQTIAPVLRGSIGWSAALAFDSNNNPRIAYVGTSNGSADNLAIASWNGSGWSISYSNNSDLKPYTMVLDGSNNALIAAFDVNSTKQTLARCSGGNWTTQIVDDTLYSGMYGSIALDASGTPHVAYTALGQGLKYATYNGSTWTTQVVDNAGTAGRYASLQMDGNYGRIAYFQDTPAYDLKYAWQDGAGWHNTVIDSAGTVGKYSSLALNNGSPAIAYYDQTNSALKYAAYNGSGWDYDVVDGASDDAGTYASLTMINGQPAIAYRDVTSGAVKYASVFTDSTPPTAALSVADITIGGAPDYTFTVTYSDNDAIKMGTLGAGNLTVTGPAGPLAVTYLGVDNATAGTPRVATYRISAPGGGWDSSDNGTYSVSLNSNQVTDRTGNVVAGGSLGSFQVNVQALSEGGDTLTVNGTDANDTITITEQNGALTVDLNGASTSYAAGRFQKVAVYGGAGNDTIALVGNVPGATVDGGTGNDTITGGAGNDSLNGGADNDSILGGDGNDSIDGGSGYDTLLGGAGDDSIRGQGGFDSIKGNGGNDTIKGNNGDDILRGNGGNDSIVGGPGNDRLIGGLDNDTLDGGYGNDTLSGLAGDDLFLAQDGAADVLMGGTGNHDRAQADDGLDTLLDINELL